MRETKTRSLRFDAGFASSDENSVSVAALTRGNESARSTRERFMVKLCCLVFLKMLCEQAAKQLQAQKFAFRRIRNDRPVKKEAFSVPLRLRRTPPNSMSNDVLGVSATTSAVKTVVVTFSTCAWRFCALPRTKSISTSYVRFEASGGASWSSRRVTKRERLVTSHKVTLTCCCLTKQTRRKRPCPPRTTPS